MDKYEYNVRYEEIGELMAKRDFARAVEVADTIDWTRVRSVKTLCKISDLYKINKRYNEAKILLEQAYDKMPTGKSIVSSLCDLCIRMGDVVGATEYYKKFVQMAPTSSQKFILLYKIYEAQDVSLEERIQVLEELKKREHIEKWCYELALLYHRIGLTTKCVEECDELILWFREGKYVKKAMELKMLHQQLTGSQEALYRNILAPEENTPETAYAKSDEAELSQNEQTEYDTDPSMAESAEPEDSYSEPSQEYIQNEEAEQDGNTDTELVKTVDVGQYSTINIQKALEESIKGSLGYDGQVTETDTVDDETKVMPVKELASDNADAGDDHGPGSITEAIMAPMMQDTGEMEEIVFPDEPATQDTIVYDPKEKERIKASATAALKAIDTEKVSKEELMKLIDEKVAYALENAMNEHQRAREELKSATISDAGKNTKATDQVNPPRSMQKMLSQEYDGQISLVVPDQNMVEKQITGQIDIEEYLSEWEDSKKQRDKTREEKIDKLVSQHTDSLLADFDTQTKEGLLEKLTEEAKAEAENDPDVDKELEKEFNADADTDTEEELPGVEELTEIEETEQDSEDSDHEPEPDDKQEQDKADEQPSGEVEEETEPESEEEPDPEDAAIEAEHIAAAEAEAGDDSSSEDSTRAMTDDETALFGSFVQTKKGRRDLIRALDSISLASYAGNVCVTGETGEESVDLAKNVVQYAKMTDSNFSGKIGKVSGSALNEKDMDALIEKLKGGGLIIEKAGDVTDETAERLGKALNQENLGILVVLQDSRKAINKLLERNEALKDMFNVHIEIEELSDDALVAYGKKYAERNEFSIDEMGILALHTRIDEMQTSDHIVTVTDVRELIDEAIDHATRFSPKHFTEILFGKRYDDEDMIILKERDFIA